MKPWVFSVFAQRQAFEGRECKVLQAHTCAVVEAVSRDEAIGKAHQIASKLFPSSKSWNAHVAISDIGNVVTVEGVVLNEG